MVANILVVDDIEQNIRLMEARLVSEYYTVYTATSGKQALDILKHYKIDVVLLDCMMPEMDGFETCKLIKADPDTTHIPVVIVTALSDMEDRVHGLEVGADEFLTKPVDDKSLFARIKCLVRIKYIIDELKLRNDTNTELGVRTVDLYQDFSQSNIVLIDDDVVEARHITNVLGQLTNNIRVVSDGNMIPTLFNSGFKPDAIVISCQLDGQNPLRLLASLKPDPHVGSASIMMLAEEDKIDMANKALDMGASDYLMVPIEQSELIARMKTQLRKKYYQDALRKDLQKGMNDAIKDGLSGLYNRRYFDRHLPRIATKAEKEGCNLYLMMIDVDYFKDVNDKYGHAAGDQIIRDVSSVISANTRAEDTVARYGGEEFVVILYDILEVDVLNVAERLKIAVGEHDFVVPDSAEVITKTISIGLTQYHSGEEVSGFLARSDKALYKAKHGGRNQVVVIE